MIEMALICTVEIMKNFFNKNSVSENFDTAEKYLIKYTQDLKLHFDLSDDELKKLVMRTYCAVRPGNPVIECLSMIKLWSE